MCVTATRNSRIGVRFLMLKSKTVTIIEINNTMLLNEKRHVTFDEYTSCPEKSKPNTMYHRNVKFERILCKFCVLDSEVLCEICTKFYLKILSDSRVINL